MILDYTMMWTMAQNQRKHYLAALPFPHICIDNFLAPEAVEFLAAEFPDPESSYWRRNDNAYTNNKRTAERVCGTHLLKEVAIPSKARIIFHEMNSAPFLWFLQQLTGIRQIIADPYFLEGGYHCVGDEGRLDVHADFSHHSFLGLERRINLLLYLNREWHDEWGGHIELYDEAGHQAGKFAPIFNRAVIFTTSVTSYHGHPKPMRLPPGVWRKSAAMYYYTMPTGTRSKHPIIFPHKDEKVAA